MILTLVVSVIVIGVIAALLHVARNRALVSDLQTKLKGFRTVPAVPVLGSIFHFRNKTSTEIFNTFIGFHRQYGRNLISQSLLNKPSLQVTDPKLIEQVMNAGTIEKSIFYDFMRDWLGNGLVVATGQRWAKHRKIITPTFHFKILEDFLVVMNHQADILMEQLSRHSNSGRDVNIYPTVGYCALDIISETAMGVRLNAQTNPQSEYVKAVKEMSDILLQRMFSMDRDFKWMFQFKRLAARQKELVKLLQEFTNSVILQRKQQLEQELLKHETTQKLAESDVYGKRKMSLLDMLLSVSVDGQQLTDDEIREEVDTFMIAGHDTTTACISFAAYYLSHNPDVQQKAYDEIKELIGIDASRVELTNNKLQTLKYLDMVIKEALRLAPSAPIIGRKSAGDMVLDGVTIPRGIDVTMVLIAMHTDPDLYPEPERFDPERFSEENQAKRTPYSYLPFSAGSRNCIGQRYALLEVKTVLVKLLATYRLLPCEPANKVVLTGDVTLKPSNGAFVKLEPRA